MILAIDSETTGLDHFHGTQPFCVIACTDAGREFEWVWRVDPLTRKVQPVADDVKAIKKLVTSADRVVCHNAKFDVQALGTIDPEIETGWPWGRTDDTAVMSHLLQSNGRKSLDVLALKYLGTDITKYEDALHTAVEHARRIARKWFPKWRIASEGDPMLPSCKGQAWRNDYWLPYEVWKRGKGREGWDRVLLDYAKPDPVATLFCYQRMTELIGERGLDKVYDHRRRLVPVVAKMERAGVTVSTERVAVQVKEYGESAEALGTECVRIAKDDYGVDLKLPKGGRSDQLVSLIVDTMRLPARVAKKSKTGKPSVDKDAMTFYLETLDPSDSRWQFCKALRSRSARNTAVTFMEGYRNFWVDHSSGGEAWKVLHPSFNMVGSDTLRFTSRNPNGQNISKKEDFNLRKVFGPAPGREWWSFDAKGIEDRLPAYKSGQQELIDIFEKPDEPPYYGSNHILRFETIYPDIWHGDLGKPCTAGKDEKGEWKCKCQGGLVALKTMAGHVKKLYADSWYQWCKNGGFAIQYGAVDKANGTGTADRAFHKAGAHAILKQRFSKLEALNRACINRANRCGYVETMPDKTVDPDRGYPLWCTRTEKGNILETVPLSYYIQGTAMWWTCKAMVRLDDLLTDWVGDGFDAFITLQVHDEIVVDMPKRADPRTNPRKSNLGRARVIQATMARGGDDFGIPLPAGCEYHPESYATGISF